MKFKLGDRVMVVGEVGTILSSIWKGRYMVHLDSDENKELREYPRELKRTWPELEIIDGGDHLYFSEWVYESDLKHARIANTKITRKLYPHYEVDGEWLIMKEGNGN